MRRVEIAVEFSNDHGETFEPSSPGSVICEPHRGEVEEHGYYNALCRDIARVILMHGYPEKTSFVPDMKYVVCEYVYPYSSRTQCRYTYKLIGYSVVEQTLAHEYIRNAVEQSAVNGL
ncbi:hypothetical protein UFOVP142_7 [uncultured Caudovirales phage]|uniref:Uncharacterized protein n=1 Tax=uncultured Caudovirales phage TaxID=2100421 RepID=A0A6J7XUC2_9CAUD|nr:hypothetical protein UFOVP142_7 [uncultured Caudovirales phage]